MSKPTPQGHERTKPLRIGGVMRCCIHTLNVAKNLFEVEGEVLKCSFCTSSLIFRDGEWEWNRPASLDA